MDRAQAAMEFLMTYGWILIVVLIAIAALGYFGIYNPAKFLPNSCTLFPGLACTEFKATPNTVNLVVRNALGSNINLQSANVLNKITGTGCSCASCPTTLVDGSLRVLSFIGCQNGNIGGRFKGEINLMYDIIGLTHSRIGDITSEIEPSSLVGGGGGIYTVKVEAGTEDIGGFFGFTEFFDKNDGLEAFASDQAIENPDYIQMAFADPNIGSGATIASATLAIKHRENVASCGGITGDRAKIICYDGSNNWAKTWSGTDWIYNTAQKWSYTISGTDIEESFDISSCITTPTLANGVQIRMTLDPVVEACGTLYIDWAEITITAS